MRFVHVHSRTRPPAINSLSVISLLELDSTGTFMTQGSVRGKRNDRLYKMRPAEEEKSRGRGATANVSNTTKRRKKTFFDFSLVGFLCARTARCCCCGSSTSDRVF
ncbi:uncharacterized [Tachysurus ichikawai]